MGSCEWLNKNKQNVDFLYSSQMINFSEKTEEKISIDPDLPELPDWLNEDFLIENKKETIKIQIEKKNDELKQRRLDYEKIKKGKAFFKLSSQQPQFEKNHNSKNDEELLDYDSERDYTDNIDDLFKNMRKQKISTDKKKINHEENDSLNFFPLKVKENEGN